MSNVLRNKGRRWYLSTGGESWYFPPWICRQKQDFKLILVQGESEGDIGHRSNNTQKKAHPAYTHLYTPTSTWNYMTQAGIVFYCSILFVTITHLLKHNTPPDTDHHYTHPHYKYYAQ